MKKIIYILMTVVALGVCTTTEAKKVQVPKMYMFGMAASFNDTIVYFTSVQEIDSAWIEKKNKFLQARQLYSYQLRDYLASAKQMPRRTCIVFADKKLNKMPPPAEHQFLGRRFYCVIIYYNRISSGNACCRRMPHILSI